LPKAWNPDDCAVRRRNAAVRECTFDIVTALDVLEHTDNDLQALREIRRVTRKDGLLLATVPATDSSGASMTKRSNTAAGTPLTNYATS